MRGRGPNWWAQAVRTWKPLVVLMGYPYVLWCFYDECVNYQDDCETLELRRADQQPLMDLMVWICLEQSQGGRYFILENGVSSALHS